MPRGGAQRGIGGEEDPLPMGDVAPLAHLAEGNDVVGAPADGAPVPARVLQQFVGLREPQRPLASPRWEKGRGAIGSLHSPGPSPRRCSLRHSRR